MKIKTFQKSTVWTIVLITLMTVVSELSSVFKDFLKSLTGHHWVTKGVVALVFFFVYAFVVDSKVKETRDIAKENKKVLWITVIGTVVILGYYLLHYF